MDKWILRLGALGLVAVLAMALTANALAQGPGEPDDEWRDRGDRLGRRLIDVTAEATGLPAEDIMARLRAGESLLEIAEANGVEPEVMLDLVKEEIGAEIESALEKESTSEFWTRLLSEHLDSALERAMNVSLSVDGHPRAVRVMNQVIQALDDEAGQSARSLWRCALSDSTLAEFAAAEGIDLHAWLADVEEHVAERLDAAVEDGWLAVEERDRAVSKLSVALPLVVNEPLPALWNSMRDNAADRVDATLVGVIADLAEVEVGELLDEPFTGQSLKEIAESYGLDPDTVLAETRDRVTDAINHAVADGYLTQAQADALLDGLGDRLDRRFESVYWPLQQWLARHMRAQGMMWR